MKQLITLITILFISLLSSPSWSETVSIDELVTNPSDGLVYRKFTSVPFTGSTTPTSDNPSGGSFKKGKKHGLWETFYENGLLQTKGNYKDGKPDGLWIRYREDGDLISKGQYLNGKREGYWERYTDGLMDYADWYEKGLYENGLKEGDWVLVWTKNGRLKRKGSYVKGKPEGLWESFFNDGDFWSSGEYVDGKREGYWKTFTYDGDVWVPQTGTFRNGKKVSH